MTAVHTFIALSKSDQLSLQAKLKASVNMLRLMTDSCKVQTAKVENLEAKLEVAREAIAHHIKNRQLDDDHALCKALAAIPNPSQAINKIRAEALIPNGYGSVLSHLRASMSSTLTGLDKDAHMDCARAALVKADELDQNEGEKP